MCGGGGAGLVYVLYDDVFCAWGSHWPPGKFGLKRAVPEDEVLVRAKAGLLDCSPRVPSSAD